MKVSLIIYLISIVEASGKHEKETAAEKTELVTN